MTRETSRRCIVAGYDGSRASRAAVSLAAERARPDGRVVVVHAYHLPNVQYGSAGYQKQLNAALTRARGLLEHLPDQVPGLAAVDWSSELLAGPAATALAGVAEAERASEIVVGTRGFGRARALLGSVAHDLIHHAPCPVTVIPERVLSAPPAGAPAVIGANVR